MTEVEGSTTVQKNALGALDRLFKSISDYAARGIQNFVAFMFFLVTVGAVFGYFVTKLALPFGEWLILVPAVLGIVAYYSRTLAIFIFVFFLLGIFII